MGIMIISGIIVGVTVGFYIYMYRKLKDLINPYHEDVITRDVLLIFSILGIMIYIALITIILINYHPTRAAKYDLQSRREILVEALNEENGLALNQEKLQKFNSQKYEYEIYKDNFWIGCFKDRVWEEVDYIELKEGKYV